MRCKLLLSGLVAALVAPVHAQEISFPVESVSVPLSGTTSNSTEPSPSLRRRVREMVGAALDGPIHPVFKGVGPSGSLGMGVGYEWPTLRGWRTSSSAVVTTRRYWNLQLDTAYERNRFEIAGYTRLRDMSQLNFFGLGAASEEGDRVSFGLRDPLVGGVATIRATPWLSVGGRIEQLWPSVDRGRSSRFPSIEERFDESGAPGLITPPGLQRYQAFVHVDLPTPPASALHAATYRASYAAYNDRELDRFDFRRLDLEAQHTFDLFRTHRLIVNALTSMTMTTPGMEVPFFLQPTLGGKNVVTSVDDDAIGSDVPRATLRGFHSLRFRDRHLVLLQSEYRIPVWGPLEAGVFADAGKVAGRAAALNFSDLRQNYGVSFSVMRGSATAARVDVAFGSGEGTQMLISVGDVLP